MSPWFTPDLLALLASYSPLCVFLCVAFALGSFLILLGLLRGERRSPPAKNPAYECGFPASGNIKKPVSVRFCLIAILFVLFDLEIVFLLPWAVCFKSLGILGYASMMLFLGVLSVGLAYEWGKGALDWT